MGDCLGIPCVVDFFTNGKLLLQLFVNGFLIAEIKRVVCWSLGCIQGQIQELARGGAQTSSDPHH